MRSKTRIASKPCVVTQAVWAVSKEILGVRTSPGRKLPFHFSGQAVSLVPFLLIQTLDEFLHVIPGNAFHRISAASEA
jgi:uncharacterized protein YqjF (DUF2071 family)